MSEEKNPGALNDSFPTRSNVISFSGRAKGEPKKLATRFTYVRDEKGLPIATLAVRRVDNEWSAVGISIKNPKDRFDRKLGRKIAQGRLEAVVRDDVTRPYSFFMDEPDDSFTSAFRWILDLTDAGELDVTRRVYRAISARLDAMDQISEG